METTHLVIDSDVIIDQLSGFTSVLMLAIDRFECSITVLSLYELVSAPVISEQQRVHLDDLLTTVGILPLDEESTLAAARAMRQLSRRGAAIGVADVLTAGICLRNDRPLLTRNISHFGRIAELQLISPDELQSRFGAG